MVGATNSIFHTGNHIIESKVIPLVNYQPLKVWQPKSKSVGNQKKKIARYFFNFDKQNL